MFDGVLGLGLDSLSQTPAFNFLQARKFGSDESSCVFWQHPCISLQVASGLTSELGPESHELQAASFSFKPYALRNFLQWSSKVSRRGSGFSKAFGIFLAVHNEEDKMDVARDV